MSFEGSSSAFSWDDLPFMLAYKSKKFRTKLGRLFQFHLNVGQKFVSQKCSVTFVTNDTKSFVKSQMLGLLFQSDLGKGQNIK